MPPSQTKRDTSTLWANKTYLHVILSNFRNKNLIFTSLEKLLDALPFSFSNKKVSLSQFDALIYHLRENPKNHHDNQEFIFCLNFSPCHVFSRREILFKKILCFLLTLAKHARGKDEKHCGSPPPRVAGISRHLWYQTELWIMKMVFFLLLHSCS